GGLGYTWVEGSDEWRVQVGIAARNGIVAARMGSLRLPAGRYPLEGSAGFYAAFGGTTEFAISVIDGLGTQWQVNDVTHKAYPCCAILQWPVGVLQQLLSTTKIAPEQIEEVRVVFNPYEADFPGT